MNLYISNGLIVDPVRNLVSPGNLRIEGDVISEISFQTGGPPAADRAGGGIHLNAGGKWVMPGLIDLHVHLREPGFEYKEDVDSGCRSAARGGFTAICCMPNTDPVIDCPYVLLMVKSRAEEANGVRVYCIGAATKGQKGKELADYEGMIRTGFSLSEPNDRGIAGISDDGRTVENGALMREAMIRARSLGLTVFSHAEPETEIVKRDLKLAEGTGCRLHLCHISERKSIELIRDAKKRGISVTAETAPHYFTLNSEDVNGDPNKKMNPPLRRKEDVEAVKQALKDGTIDVIATDHAPHHLREKNLSFQLAPNGVIGLETSFAVSYTELVRTGILTPAELIWKMSTGPARILGIDQGQLQIGAPANLVVMDVDKEYEVEPAFFASKGRNSPFIGRKVFGETAYTIAGGRIIYDRRKSK